MPPLPAHLSLVHAQQPFNERGQNPFGLGLLRASVVRESGVEARVDLSLVRWVEHSIATYADRRLSGEPREFDALVTDLAALGTSKLSMTTWRPAGPPDALAFEREAPALDQDAVDLTLPAAAQEALDGAEAARGRECAAEGQSLIHARILDRPVANLR